MIFNPRILLLLGPVICCLNCHYIENRASDIADIFRFEVRGGQGIDIGVQAGPIAHLGVGFNTCDTFGWYYGEYVERDSGVLYFPLSLFPQYGHYSLHLERQYDNSKEPDHYCYAVIPTTVTTTSVARPVHAFDVEVDLFIGFVGIKAGVSPGEILDLILGIFGIDISGDDRKAVPVDNKDQEKSEPEKAGDKK